MAKSGEYNGWKNWQTWNVALWLNNDEPLYRDMQALAHSARMGRNTVTGRRGRVNSDDAKHFVNTYLPDGTPDMIGAHRLRGVHWPSIARVINDSIT